MVIAHGFPPHHDQSGRFACLNERYCLRPLPRSLLKIYWPSPEVLVTTHPDLLPGVHLLVVRHLEVLLADQVTIRLLRHLHRLHHGHRVQVRLALLLVDQVTIHHRVQVLQAHRVLQDLQALVLAPLHHQVRHHADRAIIHRLRVLHRAQVLLLARHLVVQAIIHHQAQVQVLLAHQLLRHHGAQATIHHLHLPVQHIPRRRPTHLHPESRLLVDHATIHRLVQRLITIHHTTGAA
jgi:hypothetical protein